MASLINPACGANVASITEGEARRCAQINATIGMGVAAAVGIGSLWIAHANGKVTVSMAWMCTVALLVLLVIVVALAGLGGARSKQSQQIEMAALMKHGLTRAQAMQASFLEEGLAKSARTSAAGSAAVAS